LKGILFVTLLFSFLSGIHAQGESAVPFLLIEPSARVNGLAGSFTAVANDANAMFYNPAGISSMNYASFEYSKYEFYPYLPKLYIRFLSSTFRIPNIGSFGIDLTYFYLGEHIRTDEVGNELGKFESKEWSLSLGYSTKLHLYTSVGASFKIVRSELGSSLGPDNNTGFAFDIGVLFNNFLPELCFKRRFFDFKYQEYLQHRIFSGPSFGISIKNIGPHMTYISEAKDPLPQQLRIGAAWYLVDTDVLGLLISSDIRKLLVKRDIEGANQFYQAWFTSWKDFSFNQLKFSAGIEVTLFYILSLRAGRYLESEKYGGDNYWAYGFSIGPETLRLNWYYTENDNSYLEDITWHFGFSISY
jgi:hypothetical protein